MPRRPKLIPKFFTPRERLHVLLLFAVLVLLVSTMGRIRQPASWNWFFGVEHVETRLEQQPTREPGSRIARIAGVESRAAIPLLATARFDDHPAKDSDADPLEADPPEADPRELPTETTPPDAAYLEVAPPPLESSGAPASYNPLLLRQTDECLEVNRRYLADVKDKTAQRTEEHDAIYQLLCVAATTPPARLAAKARKDVFFENLWNEPARYREQAEPIHLTGTLRRLVRYDEKATKNPYGLPEYYEAWIFTERQSDNPMLVLFSSLPQGLKPGLELSERVSFDAFFLKILRFKARDGHVRGAPMLVGFQPTWLKVDNSTFDRQLLMAGVVTVALVLLVTLVFWWQSRRDRRLAESYRATFGAETPFLVDGQGFREERAPRDDEAGAQNPNAKTGHSGESQ